MRAACFIEELELDIPGLERPGEPDDPAPLHAVERERSQEINRLR
jgi:hypothetical protein